MKKDTSYELKKEEEAVSPVIATILMVAITVVLAGVLYVWASELAGNQTDFGTFNNYVAEDLKPTTSAAVNDPLLRLRFSNAPDDLSWAFLKVSISGEDGTLKECKIGQVSALGEEVNVVTRTVPNVVPSVFHSCRPYSSSLAVKYNSSLKTVKLLGLLPLFP